MAKKNKRYSVKIEEWSFTRLNEIKSSMIAISATDDSANLSYMIVLIPNKE